MLLIVFLTGCSKIPETHLIDHKGEGYFCGIFKPSAALFFPIEFVLPVRHEIKTLRPYSCDYLSIPFYFNDNLKKPEIIFKYDYCFMIVKGEIVDGNPKNLKTNSPVDSFCLRIDEIVFFKIVDEGFFICLLNKEMTIKRFKFFVKHPMEILKLCPHKPLEEIKEKKDSVKIKEKDLADE